jgi:hypothetical protein
MSNDPRCCGSGMCIIDNEGRCWCGQLWDGHKMCHAPIALIQTPDSTESAQPVAAVAVRSP